MTEFVSLLQENILKIVDGIVNIIGKTIVSLKYNVSNFKNNLPLNQKSLNMYWMRYTWRDQCFLLKGCSRRLWQIGCEENVQLQLEGSSSFLFAHSSLNISISLRYVRSPVQISFFYLFFVYWSLCLNWSCLLFERFLAKWSDWGDKKWTTDQTVKHKVWLSGWSSASDAFVYSMNWFIFLQYQTSQMKASHCLRICVADIWV